MSSNSNLEKLKQFDDFNSQEFPLYSKKINALGRIFHDDLKYSPKQFIDILSDKKSSNYDPERITNFFFLIRDDALLYPGTQFEQFITIPLTPELTQFADRFDVLTSLVAMKVPQVLWEDLLTLVTDSIWVDDYEWKRVEDLVVKRKSEIVKMPEFREKFMDWVNGAL